MVAHPSQPEDQLGELALHPTDRADVVGDDRDIGCRYGPRRLLLGVGLRACHWFPRKWVRLSEHARGPRIPTVAWSHDESPRTAVAFSHVPRLPVREPTVLLVQACAARAQAAHATVRGWSAASRAHRLGLSTVLLAGSDRACGGPHGG